MAQSTQANAGFGLGALTKADDLKKRLLFTVGALIIYRLGIHSASGIDPVALSEVFGQQTTGILGMFDMLSGGARTDDDFCAEYNALHNSFYYHAVDDGDCADA